MSQNSVTLRLDNEADVTSVSPSDVRANRLEFCQTNFCANERCEIRICIFTEASEGFFSIRVTYQSSCATKKPSKVSAIKEKVSVSCKLQLAGLEIIFG